MNTRRLARCKHSAGGKLLCRMLGEEKGAITIGHVIVALLVLAACAVALVMFLMTIIGMFDVGTEKDSSDDDSGADTSQGQTPPFRK